MCQTEGESVYDHCTHSLHQKPINANSPNAIGIVSISDRWHIDSKPTWQTALYTHTVSAHEAKPVFDALVVSQRWSNPAVRDRQLDSGGEVSRSKMREVTVDRIPTVPPATYSPTSLREYSDVRAVDLEKATPAPYVFPISHYSPVRTASGTSKPRSHHACDEIPAMEVLLFFAAPCVLLSVVNALWALIAVLYVTATLPLRTCMRRPTFSHELGGLLGPSLNLQLRGIHAPPLYPPDESDDSVLYRPGMLLLVHLFSPILSICFAIAAWVLAGYCAGSTVVGDPTGQDRGDDGREFVLSLRGRWERWLMRSVNDS